MDKVSKEKLSATMRAVKSRNTGGEMKLRRLVYCAGYRYQLHRSDLPGKPDLVFPGRKKIMLFHGCFWHGHDCRPKIRPTSNTDYWTPKIEGNKARDAKNIASLREAGWQVLVVWKCQLRDESAVLEQINSFLANEHQQCPWSKQEEDNICRPFLTCLVSL